MQQSSSVIVPITRLSVLQMPDYHRSPLYVIQPNFSFYEMFYRSAAATGDKPWRLVAQLFLPAQGRWSAPLWVQSGGRAAPADPWQRGADATNTEWTFGLAGPPSFGISDALTATHMALHA